MERNDRGRGETVKAFALSGHLTPVEQAPAPRRVPSCFSDSDGVPPGWARVVSAVVYVDRGTGRLVVEAFPGELWPADAEEHHSEDSPHNCDAMGCRAAHVVARADLEAPPRLPPTNTPMEVQDG